MCGIIGIINLQSNAVAIQNVLPSLAKRGPDSNGVFTDKNIALGHTRLAIQDLSEKASQPFISEDGNYIIVFNGEIYNHQELRADLIAEGQHFSSHSDTETLLKCYIKYGDKMLPLLNGIFSFAIYDKLEKKLFIAKDSFGLKPLYYYHSADCFVFSSQIKTILQLHNTPKDLNLNSFFQSTILQWPLGENTAFQTIKKLRQGHSISIKTDDLKQLKIEKWSTPLFDGLYEQKSESEWIEQLDERLTIAVKRQLLSDKPIAYFLSGGLDSSLLIAIARKIAPNKSIKAFTIDAGKSFSAEGFSDDLSYAKVVAKHLNVNLEILEANPNLVEELDSMIWELEAPQADFAPLFVGQIAKRAKQQGFDVLIGGVGADDVFSGYRRHQATSIENKIEATPIFLRKFIKNTCKLFATQPAARRLLKLSESLDKNEVERLFQYFFWTKIEIALPLFCAAAKEKININSIEEYFEKLLAEIPNEKSKLNQMLYLEMNSFLPNHNLNYTDKMGMAASVEIRVPYLDSELVAFAASMPPQLKMKGITTKYLLRKVAEKYLSKEIINRPKTGFGAPLRTWMQNDINFQAVVKSRILNSDFMSAKIFEAKAIEHLYQQTISKKEDHSYTLFALMAIESWWRQFVNEPC